ncbi:MAG TPA: glucose-6-phosphate isomerase, partial [Polyangiaceae bacterium]|nr:glucose-6-phosphate isomerase [Polyangiaceae bacterium]
MALDTSRVNLTDEFLTKMQEPLSLSFEAMAALERGAIANPDEQRMVGHYWLRRPDIAPRADLAKAITDAIEQIKTFVEAVGSGAV